MDAYRLRERPLAGETEWALEGGALVRRSPRGETRWPLADLTRLTLVRQPNRYGADLLAAQLRFGRRGAGFASRGWTGVGRPQDHGAAFGRFVRRLCAEAAQAAPDARFEVGGGPLLGQGLWWAAGLLGAGVLAMTAMAFSTGLPAMGVDLAARLLFALILLFAAAPWLPGRRSRAFDPLDPPEALAPGR